VPGGGGGGREKAGLGVAVRTGDDGGEAGGGDALGDLVGGGAPGEARGAPAAQQPRRHHLRSLSLARSATALAKGVPACLAANQSTGTLLLGEDDLPLRP
jgi:hypothetical protein